MRYGGVAKFSNPWRSVKVHRREYKVRLVVNGRKITKVIIDPHYEAKHSRSINDELILNLVMELNEKSFEPEESDDRYEYFVADRLEHNGKLYKLIWLLERHAIYIGVVNADRRN